MKRASLLTPPFFLLPAQGTLDAQLRDIAKDFPLETYVHVQECNMHRRDSRAALVEWGKLKRPTLIASGEDDPHVGWERQQEMHDLVLEGSKQAAGSKRHFNRLVKIAKCGHFPQLERTEELNGLLKTWLQQPLHIDPHYSGGSILEMP